LSRSRAWRCRTISGNDALARELLYEQVSETRFIEYNGGLKINDPLLSVVLRD
jgi:hypothetical protein